MANYFAEFDSTPATVVADVKARILLSTDWTNIAGGTGHVVSATTARGAQMAVDLSDAAATSRQMQLGVYRTYSASVGTDKLVRYICWRTSATGATTDPIHCMLSAGKDHLFIAIEGPRVGEPTPDSVADGSARQCLWISDLVPYFAGEPNPVVAMLGNPLSLSSQQTDLVVVSRNRANNASWVPARLATLTFPGGQPSASSPWYSQQRLCSADGNTYLWPYVVIEDTAGLRGRLGKVFFTGWNSIIQGLSPDFPPAVYARTTYNSENYINILPTKGGGSSQTQRTAFGFPYQQSGAPASSPVIAVPTA